MKTVTKLVTREVEIELMTSIGQRGMCNGAITIGFVCCSVAFRFPGQMKLVFNASLLHTRAALQIKRINTAGLTT